MGKPVFVVLYVAAMAAVIVGMDVMFCETGSEGYGRHRRHVKHQTNTGLPISASLGQRFPDACLPAANAGGIKILTWRSCGWPKCPKASVNVWRRF